MLGSDHAPHSILDGLALSGQVLEACRQGLAVSLKNSELSKKPPQLAFIRVGEDPASIAYLKRKDGAANQVGILVRNEVFSEKISQQDLLDHIRHLNQDQDVHGILVQSPLPAQLSAQVTFSAIDPRKDVDGFHPENLGRLLQGDQKGLLPCTPAGVLQLLAHNGIQTSGQHVVIVGRSLIVTKPLGLMLLGRGLMGDATVTFCHSKTPDFSEKIRHADILIVAAGCPMLIGPEQVKPGAVVVDVGINRVADFSKKTGFRLVGDVDYQGVLPQVKAITPVPGGVGPMTVAMLMVNTLRAWARQVQVDLTQTPLSKFLPR